MKVHHESCTPIINEETLRAAIQKTGIKMKAIKPKKRTNNKAIKFVKPKQEDINCVLLDIIIKCMATSTSSKKSSACHPVVISKLFVNLGHIVVENDGKLCLTSSSDLVTPFTIPVDSNGIYDIDIFRFLCLQQYYLNVPSMLSQIGTMSKIYKRSKGRREIKAGDTLSSSKNLNEYIDSLKPVRSSSSSSSSSELYHKELLICFAYTQNVNTNTITTEYLQHLIKTLRIPSNALLGKLKNWSTESDDDDYESYAEYERIFSQNQQQEDPGKLTDKKQDARDTRDNVPLAKSLLQNLQTNSDESNPFFQGISDKIEGAMVKWLTLQPEGKTALQSLREGGMESMSKFKVGPVNLPDKFMPDPDHIYWKASLGSAPYDIIRSRYPTQSSGELAPHSSTTTPIGLERGLVDCFQLLVDSRGGGRETHKSRALQVGNLYFRRDPKLQTAVSSPGEPNESIIDVLKKLRQADSQSYALLLEMPGDNKKLAFEVSLTNDTCIRYSIKRAETITLQLLMEDPNIAVPVCVKIVVEDDVVVLEDQIFDLFSD